MKELLYQKIAESIRNDIKTGNLDSGMRLSGVRELSSEWNTSANTVLKALSLLEQEGYLRKTQGQGIFVEPEASWSSRDEEDIELLVYDLSTPLNMSLIRDIERTAGDYGYRLTVKSFSGTDLKTAPGIAGRIIIPESAGSLASAVPETDLPTVFIGDFNPPDDFSYSYAVADTYAGFYRAAEMLFENGRERIAYIGGSERYEDEAGWNACRDLLSGTHNGFRREYAVSAGGWSAGQGQAAMENILLAGEYPDGLVCANDTLAAGAYRACRAAGLSIPEDIAVISAGDQDIAPLLEPPLSSLRFPSAVMALTAVNYIDSLLKNRLPADEHIRARFDLKLAARDSVTPAGAGDEYEDPADESAWL